MAVLRGPRILLSGIWFYVFPGFWVIVGIMPSSPRRMKFTLFMGVHRFSDILRISV